MKYNPKNQFTVKNVRVMQNLPLLAFLDTGQKSFKAPSVIAPEWPSPYVCTMAEG